MGWVVTGAAAVAVIAGRSCYLGRGDTVPPDTENVAHLAEVGLITEIRPARPAPKPSTKKPHQ